MEVVQVNFKDRVVIKHHHQKIIITIHENTGFSGVSFGIKAPLDILVNRPEIAEAKQFTSR